MDLAVRCAEWLLTHQNKDGSFNGLDGVARPFDTAGIVEGLKAMFHHTAEPHYIVPIAKAIGWLNTQIHLDGYLINSPNNRSPEVYNLRASSIIENRDRACAGAGEHEPEVVFLDEPTDGVDPVGRKEIRDLLRSLKEKGTTVFLNSHLLSEVELLCDRVAILDRGRIVRTGTVEELTTSATDYTIGFEGILPQQLMDEMRARVVPATVEGNLLRTRVAGAAELNAVIDLLRANGVTITSVARQRTTLEESFMNLVGGTTAS